MNSLRKHLKYANVTATIALVFAMSGGALAATHYVINSTRQISPKALKALKGNRGPAGAQGATGREGAPGKGGAPGNEGKEGPRGPSAGFVAFKDEPGELTGAGALGKLAVPAGSYLVSAKLWIINFGATREAVGCGLSNSVNSDEDETEVTVEPKGATGDYGRTPIVLEAASTLATAGFWTVDCSSAVSVHASNLKIEAVQVGTLTKSGA